MQNIAVDSCHRQHCIAQNSSKLQFSIYSCFTYTALSIPLYTGSGGNRFQETHGTWVCRPPAAGAVLSPSPPRTHCAPRLTHFASHLTHCGPQHHSELEDRLGGGRVVLGWSQEVRWNGYGGLGRLWNRAFSVEKKLCYFGILFFVIQSVVF